MPDILLGPFGGTIADLINRNITMMYTVSGACVLAAVPLLAFSRAFHELMAFEAPAEDGAEPEVDAPDGA
jgi:hypothetical protein